MKKSLSILQSVLFVLLIVAFTIVSAFAQDNDKKDKKKKSEIVPSTNGVDINKNRDEGVTLFKNRIIIPTQVIDPGELAGSLLLIDNFGQTSATAEWIKVVPTKQNPDPEFQNEIVYQSIVDKSFLANATYLTVSANATAEDKVELIVEDVIRFKGDSFAATGVSEAVTTLFSKLPNKANRRYFYIQNVQYTTVKYKVFKKVEGKAQFSGVGFGANGSVYASDSKFSLDRIVSVNYIEVEPTVKNNGSGTSIGNTIIGNDPKSEIKLKVKKPDDSAGQVILNLSKLKM